jgi:hypothetical protein
MYCQDQHGHQFLQNKSLTTRWSQDIAGKKIHRSERQRDITYLQTRITLSSAVRDSIRRCSIHGTMSRCSGWNQHVSFVWRYGLRVLGEYPSRASSSTVEDSSSRPFARMTTVGSSICRSERNCVASSRSRFPGTTTPPSHFRNLWSTYQRNYSKGTRSRCSRSSPTLFTQCPTSLPLVRRWDRVASLQESQRFDFSADHSSSDSLLRHSCYPFPKWESAAW